MTAARAAVVGAGIMGTVAALELARRGFRVTLLDSGRVAHPLAASTDISKVCRMEYGKDDFYMALMERAREGWLEWNRRWQADAGPDAGGALFHETGVLMVCLEPMAAGGFEFESFEMLVRRGHEPERIGGAALAKRFPAWSERFVDGFFHSRGGWVESGRVVERLARAARRAGVEVVESERVVSLTGSVSAATGVATESGRRIEADAVVLAGGSWLARANLLPELATVFKRTYHPVWHLRPRRPERFTPDRFPVFTADIARTGFYGFPLHPSAGVVKMGHHGLGFSGAGEDLAVPDETTAKLRRFLAVNLPALADAEIVATRMCPYCDTEDEDFWIAGHPERAGVTVASGGSGHGFKFAPVLGAIIADAVEGRENAASEKFGWRTGAASEPSSGRRLEAARCHEPVL